MANQPSAHTLRMLLYILVVSGYAEVRLSCLHNSFHTWSALQHNHWVPLGLQPALITMLGTVLYNSGLFVPHAGAYTYNRPVSPRRCQHPTSWHAYNVMRHTGVDSSSLAHQCREAHRRWAALLVILNRLAESI